MNSLILISIIKQQSELIYFNDTVINI